MKLIGQSGIFAVLVFTAGVRYFQPWIQMESPDGKVIQFNSSNPLVTYLTPTETATTVEGDQTIEAKKWVSGEGAIYTIPAGVTVKAVQSRETGCDTTFAGSFECNDNDYNILWTKGARTVYICMRDHFLKPFAPWEDRTMPCCGCMNAIKP